MATELTDRELLERASKTMRSTPATDDVQTEVRYSKAYNVPDTRAATESDSPTGLTTTQSDYKIRELIGELEAANRLAIRDMESDAIWIRRMQDQTAKHLDMLLQMKATLDAIQSWIGGD